MIVSVTQLNNYIKGVMDLDETLNFISVKGEVTSCKMSHGNIYMTISDDGGQIDCFSFGDLVTQPEVGVNVVVTGKVRYLPKYGKISLFVSKIQPADFGKNYLLFVELRDRLQKEGLFDLARKKALPKLPKKIGVVTSRTGAVIRDITDVVSRRQPFTDILLYPVHVQGDSAEDEIVDGINYFSRTQNVDVVIVARGGGSNEDLSVFNSERIVRAVAACPLPIVSAIGHGVDFTLTDFAADQRAVTPTEAGELVTVDVITLYKYIDDCLYTLSTVAENSVRTRQHMLSRALYSMYSVVGSAIQQRKNFILSTLSEMQWTCQQLADKRRQQVEMSLQKLSDNNPAKILSKGYAVVEKKGHRVTSSGQLTTGDEVLLKLSDGSANAVITASEVNK